MGRTFLTQGARSTMPRIGSFLPVPDWPGRPRISLIPVQPMPATVSLRINGPQTFLPILPRLQPRPIAMPDFLEPMVPVIILNVLSENCLRHLLPDSMN